MQLGQPVHLPCHGWDQLGPAVEYDKLHESSGGNRLGQYLSDKQFAHEQFGRFL